MRIGLGFLEDVQAAKWFLSHPIERHLLGWAVCVERTRDLWRLSAYMPATSRRLVLPLLAMLARLNRFHSDPLPELEHNEVKKHYRPARSVETEQSWCRASKDNGLSKSLNFDAFVTDTFVSARSSKHLSYVAVQVTIQVATQTAWNMALSYYNIYWCVTAFSHDLK